MANAFSAIANIFKECLITIIIKIPGKGNCAMIEMTECHQRSPPFEVVFRIVLSLLLSFLVFRKDYCSKSLGF